MSTESHLKIYAYALNEVEISNIDCGCEICLFAGVQYHFIRIFLIVEIYVG